jgi:RNA polymerase sigma factor (sigma-70 family)
VRRHPYPDLIEQHRGELRAHCMRILRSREDAEDALQETFLRAWRSMDQFEGRGSLRSWLYMIATNVSLDQMRRRDRAPIPTGEAGAPSPEDDVERRESLQRVIAAAVRLTDRQRAVFAHRYLAGLSAQETAEALGVTLATVNSALQRARSGLRKALGVPTEVGSED